MPHIAKIHGNYASLMLTGLVAVEDVEQITSFLTTLEVNAASSLHRLVDVSGVKELKVDFSALHRHSSRRAQVKLRNNVKTAIVAVTNEQYGMARMFEMLNQQQQTEVAVFRETGPALQWLNGQSGAFNSLANIWVGAEQEAKRHSST